MTDKDKMQDARDVRDQAHHWVNTMLAAGITEQAAVVGAMQALIERALISGGADKTANWLRSQATQIDMHGNELLRLLKN